MIAMYPGVWTIFHGAGAPLIFGTPCGRQLASGSSFSWAPSMRDSYSVFAQAWNGTSPGFRSAAMSRTYLLAFGSQMPERSGWPSAVFGAAAERFVPLEGMFRHCPCTDAQSNRQAERQRADFIARPIICVSASRQQPAQDTNVMASTCYSGCRCAHSRRAVIGPAREKRRTAP